MLKVMQTENSYEVVLMLTDWAIIKGNTPFCDLTVGSSHLSEADALWGGVKGQGIWVHGEARGTGFPRINGEHGALTESRSYRGERGWSSSWFLTRVGGKIQSTLSCRGPRGSTKAPQRRSWDIRVDPGKEGGSRCKRAEAQGKHSDSREGGDSLNKIYKFLLLGSSPKIGLTKASVLFQRLP